jgi:hypothetical protein
MIRNSISDSFNKCKLVCEFIEVYGKLAISIKILDINDMIALEKSLNFFYVSELKSLCDKLSLSSKGKTKRVDS